MKKKLLFLFLLSIFVFGLSYTTVSANEHIEFTGSINNKNSGFLVNNKIDFDLNIKTSVIDNFTKEKEVNAERTLTIDVFKNKKLYQSDTISTTKDSIPYLIKSKKMKANDKIKINITLYKNNIKLSQKRLSFSILDKKKFNTIKLDTSKDYVWNVKKKKNLNILMQVFSVSDNNKKSKLKKPIYISLNASDKHTYIINKIKDNKYKMNLNASAIDNNISNITLTPFLENSNIPFNSSVLNIDIERDVLINKLSFARNNYTLDKNESFKLEPIYKPLDSSEIHKLKWVSSNPDIVRVYSDGTLKALKKGTAQITVSSEKTKNIVDIKVIQSIKSIKTPEKAYFINVDDTFQIPYTINPIDSDVTKNDIKVVSSDSKIVEVLDSTKIKAHKEGKVTLTISYNEIKTNIVIHVQPKLERIDVTKEKYYIAPNETISVSFTTYPTLSAFSKKPNISFSSNHPDIVEVNSNGKVKGIKPGIAIITLKFKNTEQNVQIEVSNPKVELPLKQKTFKTKSAFKICDIVSIDKEELISVKSEDSSIVSLAGDTFNVHKSGETYVIFETKDAIGILRVIVVTDSKKPTNNIIDYKNMINVNTRYVCYTKKYKPIFSNVLYYKQ